MGRNKRIVRRVVTDSERWRIALLAEYGFYGRVIAARIFGGGNPNYTASDTEIRRVYRVAKEEGVKLSDWRKGENDSSQKVLNGACRVSTSGKHPKLRIVA
jgi:hypothetical protein